MSTEPLAGTHEADVVVIGAGLAGAAVAAALARRGLQAVVLAAAAETPDGHLASGPDLLYVDAIARWGRDGARAIWDCHREGHALLREGLGAGGDDCGYRGAGGFVLAEGRAAGAALAESEDLLRDDGFSGEFFDQYMLETRFDVAGFTAGYWAADEAELEGRRLEWALLRDASARGARRHGDAPVLHLGVGPQGVEAVTAQGRVQASWALLAGAEAVRLLPDAARGLELHAAQAATLAAPPALRLPSPTRVAGRGVSWRVTAQGLVATEAAAARSPAAFESLLARWVPGAGGVTGRVQALHVSAADGLPVIGPLPGRPLALTAACGVALAPLAARWIVAAMQDGCDATPDAFRAARVLEPPRVPQ